METHNNNCAFIKNKVVKHIVKASVEKATLIPYTHVTHGIDDYNEIGHAWMVRNQQCLDVTYKVSFPFTKYTCCTCEGALRGNLCKHQVVIFYMCIDLTEEILFNIVGHGMDLTMKVLSPFL